MGQGVEITYYYYYYAVSFLPTETYVSFFFHFQVSLRSRVTSHLGGDFNAVIISKWQFLNHYYNFR